MYWIPHQSKLCLSFLEGILNINKECQYLRILDYFNFYFHVFVILTFPYCMVDCILLFCTQKKKIKFSIVLLIKGTTAMEMRQGLNFIRNSV